MSVFTGTLRLTRLALRRDRIKLPIIILALVGFMAPSIASVMSLYDTPSERQSYASLAAPNVVTRIFGGPLNGADIGAIAMNETFLYVALAMAFVSTLTVIRHTRQNEETGREELIGSAVVGRHASLVAALLVSTGINLVLAILMTLSLVGNDLPVGGSIAAGAALGGIGLAFTGIAAVVAQISSSARGANGLAAIAIGSAFLLRALGDALGQVHDLKVTSLWPSWLSPLGWGQQIHPYTQQRWGIFGLFALSFAATTGLAFYLTVKRDVGGGLLQPRKGPPRAAASLLSPLGLAWRLQRGTLRGWAITLLVLAACYGYVGKAIGDFINDNPQMADLLRQWGGGGSLTDAYLGTIMGLMGVAIAGYVVQSLLRLRAEEANGTLEAILATGTSRFRWAMSHITCSLGGAVILSLISGLGVGVAFALAVGGDSSKAWEICAAALIQLPAISVLGGVVVLCFSMAPRLTIAISWSALSFCLLVSQFAALLKLPHWVESLSPFGHTPTLPAETLRWTPLIVLSAVALALFAAGLASFRRRNIAVN